LEREVVIENDIAWRVHTLVDFMFPAPPRIVSTAKDEATRRAIESVLATAFDASADGEGAALWQNAALLGSVYGHVDFLVSMLAPSGGAGEAGGSSDDGPAGALASEPSLNETLHRVRSSLVIETVEAPRAIALLNAHDYRVFDAYILRWEQPTNEIERESMLSRVSRFLRITPTDAHPWASAKAGGRRSSVTITQIFSADRVQRYEDDRLVFEQVNRLGRVPVVHVQNLPQPLCWEGLSDVEPLIPLQDELNTRLSDRANRVTMQSFRMWLGKGIENFNDRPVGPGQMWMTENLDASIEAFGGDADSPSERQHIEDLREAMDKASGVTPAAAGHIKAKVGNLTSENALRISLMGTLAKTKRKRLTYGAGIARLCELILHALDVHGVHRSDPTDRGVEIAWSDPLPIDETRRLNDGLLKVQLGVPAQTVRGELGYAAITS
ncbi:MAG TPA: phage portal protein, partial [Phycisphaerales bacterium]|nr:phage portal protein [Phycisphaerales bacterium]